MHDILASDMYIIIVFSESGSEAITRYLFSEND